MHILLNCLLFIFYFLGTYEESPRVTVTQTGLQIQRKNELHSFCRSFIASNSNYSKALLYDKVKSKPIHTAN